MDPDPEKEKSWRKIENLKGREQVCLLLPSMLQSEIKE